MFFKASVLWTTYPQQLILNVPKLMCLVRKWWNLHVLAKLGGENI